MQFLWLVLALMSNGTTFARLLLSLFKLHCKVEDMSLCITLSKLPGIVLSFASRSSSSTNMKCVIRACFSATVYCSFHLSGRRDFRSGRVSFFCYNSERSHGFVSIFSSIIPMVMNQLDIPCVLIIRVKQLSTLLIYGTSHTF